MVFELLFDCVVIVIVMVDKGCEIFECVYNVDLVKVSVIVYGIFDWLVGNVMDVWEWLNLFEWLMILIFGLFLLDKGIVDMIEVMFVICI